MRASLLINCSGKEAEQVRKQAALQRRTVSGYVINIVIRAVDFSDDLVSSLVRPLRFRLSQGPPSRTLAPRTTLHIYCSGDEAKRIRGAALQRKMTISSFVLTCLHRSWATKDAMETLPTRAASRKVP